MMEMIMQMMKKRIIIQMVTGQGAAGNDYEEGHE